MRRLLGVLRRQPAAAGPSPSSRPQPGAHDLSALIRSWTDAGLDVDLSVQGDLDQLPPGIDLTAYRVVQEALTNTFKHAGPARARGVDRARAVRAADRGHRRRSGRGGHAAGRRPVTGSSGMHERVALYGGTVDTGPRAGGGFAVRALVPLTATRRSTAAMTIRIVVVDDQALVRTGFAMIIGAEPDLEVVGEAADGLEALDASSPRPDPTWC